MIIESLGLLKARRRLRSVAIDELNTMKSDLDDLGKPEGSLEEYIRTLEEGSLILDHEIIMILDQVHQLQDETLIRVLLYRYDHDWTISAIADKLHYSTQWIHEIINKGISALNRERD